MDQDLGCSSSLWCPNSGGDTEFHCHLSGVRYYLKGLHQEIMTDEKAAEVGLQNREESRIHVLEEIVQKPTVWSGQKDIF